MTTEDLTPTIRWSSIVSVWVLAAVAALIVAFVTPEDLDTTWFGLSLAGCVIIAMCIQLATQQKNGFIERFGLSIGGAFVVLAVASGVVALVHV